MMACRDASILCLCVTLCVWVGGCSGEHPLDADLDADVEADADEGDADQSGDAEPDSDLEDRLLEAGASARLVVSGDGEVRLERGDGEVVARLPLSAFEVGVVPVLDPNRSFDPYFLEDAVGEGGIYVPPRGLAWHRPSAAVVEDDGEGLALALTYDDGRTGRVLFSVSAEGRFEARWSLPEGAPAVVFARLRLRVSAEERFYGLGEHFDHVEHRGRVRAMQIEPAALESANNEAHVPIPLLIGTGGWGIYVDSRRPGVFDVASEEEELVKVTYGLGLAADQGLRFFLMAEPHPLDVTRHYYEVTGAFGPVAPWALGPWIWRDEVDGQAAVEQDLQTLRDLDLATTGYWIDRPYASAVNSFDFEPADYDDPAAMMALADDLGLRVALWHTPYVDPDDEDSRPLNEQAEASGFFPPLRTTALVRWGSPIDFTNPEAYAWWQELLSGYQALGVVGYKLDYAEEVTVGAFGIRLPWRFFDGSDELTMHRGYMDGYHQVYAETLPEEGGFLLCRAAAPGGQRRGVIIWPGDIDGNMARMGDEVEDPPGSGETYLAVGGLPAAVVASSSLGPSGFPLFGSDTGGYRHTPPDRETYIRWFQHTALTTVMQVGTSANDLPWDLGELGLDEEVLALYRRYARLHLRLFPYLWTALEQLRRDGRAIQRPLGLAHPELGLDPDDVYLLGDHLLVAPVVDPGVREREVPLPAGLWQDWWTGELHEGGAATIDAPLGTLPLLVRLWAPIPLLRPTIDTLEPVADPGAIDSLATGADPLWVRVGARAEVAAEASGEATLYDGTALSVSAAGGAGCAELTLGRVAGEVFAGAVVFELVGGAVTGASWSGPGGDTPLAQTADQGAFDAASAAWLVTEPGRALLKLPADGTALSVTLCSE